MKRCREDKKNNDNSSKKKIKLRSDLNLDVLGEIKKKLFGAAHIRFGAVCKNWMAAQHEKRAADVLPWLMVLYRTNISVEVNEEFDDKEPLCAAQEVLLMVHTVILNALASLGDSYKKDLDKEEFQLLVPSSQSANVIGKSGSTIKTLRSKTRTNIRVTSKGCKRSHSFLCHALRQLYSGRNQDALEWSARQNIAVGAAGGLRYLHEECKVDVYSFGVVLVELITGRKAIDLKRPL